MSSIFNVPELAIGVGLSEAASVAFEPKVETPKQSAWLNNPVRLPDIGLIAALYAGGKISKDSAQNMANRLGFSHGTLDSVTWLAQNRLDFPVMLRMWRLAALAADLPRTFGTFDETTLSERFDETLAHEQLDWNYRPLLRALRHAEIVGLGDIGYGVVRGMLPAPSWVPVAPPTHGDKVPRFPQVDIDPVKLANALGYSEDMLQLIVGRSGLSMAPVMAAQAHFRDIIGPNDFLLAIAEGDLRTEWAEPLLEVSRQILTADQYVEAHLRGWTDEAEMYAGTAKHGMSQADTSLLFKTRGRPITTHQIVTGLARGGTYPSTYADVPEPYRKSLQESNIRPEWASLDYHNRYTYPSAFVFRQLMKDGALTETQAEQYLLELGWPPHLAKLTAAAYVPKGTAAADPHVTKAETQLWTTTHRMYVQGGITEAEAATALGEAGVAAAAVPVVLAKWTHEAGLERKRLSAAQVKKAWVDLVINPATGVKWTKAEAIDYLHELGYSVNDANTFLEL